MKKFSPTYFLRRESLKITLKANFMQSANETIIVTCYFYFATVGSHETKERITFFLSCKLASVPRDCEGRTPLELSSHYPNLRFWHENLRSPVGKRNEWTKGGKVKRKVRKKFNDDIVESIHTMASTMKDFPLLHKQKKKSRKKEEITDNENNCKQRDSLIKVK